MTDSIYRNARHKTELLNERFVIGRRNISKTSN